MYPIVRREQFSDTTFLWEVHAPDIAQSAQPGHFVMLRLYEGGERIPLTVAEYDREGGTITMVVKKVGHVVLVGGGLGVAAIFPQLRAFKEIGNRTTVIMGFRTKDLVFWEDKFRRHADDLIICTDDGSYGRPGFVTAALEEGAERDQTDLVLAIGPLPMMYACIAG